MEEKIYQFIYTSLNDNIHFDKSANLIEEQIINSMGFLSFINFLEDEFNVEIELDEVSEDNFSTIEDIAYFVKKRQVEH
ncbi:MAG: acyl carrier protein [Cytophagales bacterium]|nr:acyl carrier protein [Cytophagales bacterium]